MADETTQIQGVSQGTQNLLLRKSANTLPNRPSEQGYSADEIKRRLYAFITDAQNSIIAELNRIVAETNTAILSVKERIDEFRDNSLFEQPYLLEIAPDTWTTNATTGNYEIVLTPEMHKITKYQELSIEMYLSYEDGKYTRVNQYDIYPFGLFVDEVEVYSAGSIVLHSNTEVFGFVQVSRNRTGYFTSTPQISATDIVGLSKVGRTNDYNDLDNAPTAILQASASTISQIIQGALKTGATLHADNADSASQASFATSSGTSQSCSGNATTATRAHGDEDGIRLKTGYVRASDLGSGGSFIAGRAYGDEDGANIKSTYFKGILSGTTLTLYTGG